jgi:hypothetical protein
MPNEVVRTDELQALKEPTISEEIQKVIDNILYISETAQIKTPEQYIELAKFLMKNKSYQEKWEEEFIEPWRVQKKHADGQIKNWNKLTIQKLEKAEAIEKKKLIGWKDQQEILRQKEQKKLQAKENARIAKEKERLIKQAKKLKTPELKEQKIKEADELEPMTITVPSIVPKVEGIVYKKLYKGKVIDKKAFLKEALQNESLLIYVDININKLAASQRGEIQHPGTEFYQEETLAAGGK